MTALAAPAEQRVDRLTEDDIPPRLLNTARDDALIDAAERTRDWDHDRTDAELADEALDRYEKGRGW